MFSELLQEGGLSFDRLQSFCLVAQAGGVTRAAKGDAAKQSLFSRQIKELEEFFGTELIRRTGRGIALTEAGERLRICALECFAVLMDFKSECKRRPIEVVLGTGESIIQWLLMPRLATIRQALPNVRLKFLNLPTSEAVRRVTDGLIDFALIRDDAVTHSLEASPLGAMEYSLFVPREFSFHSQRQAKLRFLNELPLATLEGEGSFRTELSEFARKQGMKMNIQVECSSFPLAAHAVVRGKVAAILPSIAAIDLIELGAKEMRLEFLKIFERQMCIACNHRTLRIRPVLEKVRAVLEEICRF
ncbi:MAG: LysR family transcriptional regulator [Verrucomicrobiales bacterium]|nr:LysR family transcriptional regulator [Verrucomicrobiales bacterium]